MTRPAQFALTAAATALLGLLLGIFEPAQSYAPATHGEIGGVAVDRSDLDSVLKARYAIEPGIALAINGQTVRTWVTIGAAREDVPDVRSLNHFHNPLKLWPDAGGLFGQSSVRFQQNPDQGPGGTWSWPVARRRFYDFLTLPSPKARQEALSDTARALGQTMHMTQDATSPAHTRDDPHLFHDGYEARIEELRTSDDTSLRARFEALLTAPSLLPAPAIFASVDDAQAPAPIARLIDNEKYTGSLQSYSVSAQTGVAEYTNGGYVSDDTIFLGFALPRRESLGPAVFDPSAGSPGARRYFPKTGEGDPIDHFVAEGALYERLLFRGQLVGGFVLDDKIYEDYAAQLLPRAVGYSAGLLNYFFRGNFDFAVDVSHADPSKRFLTVSIPSDPAAEAMDGTFTLLAEDKDGLRSPVPGASITTALGRGGFLRTAFTPGTGVRAYVLAFQGKLGDEPGAVTGKVRPMGPLVSAVQAVAEFTGEEQRTIVTETDNAATLVVVEQRTRDERHQRARGTFASAETNASGQHLRRVSLEFDSRVVGAPAARLFLDDLDVGVAWTRGQSLVGGPSRWEVQIDLPAFFGGLGGLAPNAPRFLVVETTEGVKIRTPLVWWRSASSLTEARGLAQTVTACPAELQCEEVTSTSRLVRGLVFFGDGSGDGRDLTPSGQRAPLTATHTSVGFVPIGMVAGYGVGTVEQSGDLNCFDACISAASCSTSAVSVFAQSAAGGPVWIKDGFSVSSADLDGVRKPAAVCTRPAVGQPAAGELPELRFRRDYLPAEQGQFQEFGVIPPAHEITLR